MHVSCQARRSIGSDFKRVAVSEFTFKRSPDGAPVVENRRSELFNLFKKMSNSLSCACKRRGGLARIGVSQRSDCERYEI